MAARRKIIIGSIVLALYSAAVILNSVQCNSVGQQQDAKLGELEAASKQQASKQVDQPVEPKSLQSLEQASQTSDQAAKAAADSNLAAEQARKGRSEAPTSGSDQPAAAAASSPEKAAQPTSAAAEPAKSLAAPAQQNSNKAVSTSATSNTKPASTSSGSKQLAGKSQLSSSGKRLPANLGTVTSTGSGGPAHYMPKQDPYSAIAEKHGPLDTTRKADKRNHHHQSNLQRFTGIQKASGFSDAINPFKTVTDGGLARTLGASVRSIMKGKYSIPAYVASAVLGAVALMAFYESPISPLPVPPLPEPPVGRFPPEMPVISPNMQIPFRMNQQQQQQYGQQQTGYGANQRSFQAGASGSPMAQQPQQSVLFPGQAAGASTQNAQQREGAAPGPVQQLAANLISTVSAATTKQSAQRKSGPDTEPASSRSFLGGSNKLDSPANQQQHKQAAGSSFLSFFGLGSSNAAAAPVPHGPNQVVGALGDIHRASGLGSHHQASGASHSQLGSSSSLSNSHLINKMKSYFDKPVPHNSWSMDHNVPNQYDQYRRMSVMQALAKDTAFLSSFFSPSRRSSNATAASPASNVATIQQSINAVFGGNAAVAGAGSPPAPSATQQVASSRMQVDSGPALTSLIQSPFSSSSLPSSGSQPNPVKRISSGFGLMRAANALLETFTSNLLHRSESGSSKKANTASLEEQQHNALASSVSLLSDIMSSYNAAQQASQQYQPQQTQQQAEPNKQQHVASAAAGQANADQALSGRSADSTSSSDKPSGEQSAAKPPQVSASHAAPEPQQQQASLQTQQQPLSRKVRSIGLDYPMGQTHYHQQQQQQQQQQPSRASQINSLVDFVSDSYKQNKLLFNLVMNQVGLSQALPYVEQFLDNPNESKGQH